MTEEINQATAYAEYLHSIGITTSIDTEYDEKYFWNWVNEPLTQQKIRDAERRLVIKESKKIHKLLNTYLA